MNDRCDEVYIQRDERGCPVAPRISRRERFARLEAALARLSADGAVVKAPVAIREWRGEPCTGCFVRVDATTYALHVGRGAYIFLDIERDLNGVLPREATRLMLQRSGIVREPDVRRSHGR